MNIGDLERAKDVFTGKASDVVRQFAFAGIAVIWLLRIDKSTHPIPQSLAPALALFAVALACDLFQYAISSLIWTVYYRKKLRENLAGDAEFEGPPWLPMPGYVLFYLKILTALAAWLCLAKYLVEMWWLV
jgi:hypothetical protein